jgi:G3E family GTPase
MPVEKRLQTREPIKFTILGGYLGAGKTTWLRHQLHSGIFKDAYLIVNEAADEPIDDELLGDSSRLAVLAGGCACCVGKDKLLSMLRAILGAPEDPNCRASEIPRRIVLETSGLADPASIVEAIRTDPFLSRRLIVSETIVVVDAVHALVQLRSEKLARRQIEAADCLIVSKVEAPDRGHLERTVATLRFLNAAAPIFGAVRGVEAALPAEDAAEPQLAIVSETDVSPEPIFATTLNLDGRADWSTFSVWLSALLHARGDDVVRVKGILPSPAGRLLIQTVHNNVQAPEVLPPRAEGDKRSEREIVVIGRGYRADALQRSLRYFVEGQDVRGSDASAALPRNV